MHTLRLLLDRLLRYLSWSFLSRQLQLLHLLLLHTDLLLRPLSRYMLWQPSLHLLIPRLLCEVQLLRWMLLLYLLGCHSQSISRCQYARRLRALATLCGIMVTYYAWRRQNTAHTNLVIHTWWAPLRR